MNTKELRKLHIDEQKQLDISNTFTATEYLSYGYYLHFHRNTEIYCVDEGEMLVTVNGTEKILKESEIVLINGLYSHSYQTKSYNHITFMHIGTMYTESFQRIYHGMSPAVWLNDANYNRKYIIPIMKDVVERGQDMSVLERVGVVNILYAKIIDKYGFAEKEKLYDDKSDVNNIIQYIYDNSDEEINLNGLAKVFGYAPQSLSRKLSPYIKTDLRIFVNDVRIQKVLKMLGDQQYEDMTLLEIINRCGFNSLASFYRSYKRNFKYNDLPRT